MAQSISISQRVSMTMNLIRVHVADEIAKIRKASGKAPPSVTAFMSGDFEFMKPEGDKVVVKVSNVWIRHLGQTVGYAMSDHLYEGIVILKKSRESTKGQLGKKSRTFYTSYSGVMNAVKLVMIDSSNSSHEHIGTIMEDMHNEDLDADYHAHVDDIS